MRFHFPLMTDVLLLISDVADDLLRLSGVFMIILYVTVLNCYISEYITSL